MAAHTAVRKRARQEEWSNVVGWHIRGAQSTQSMRSTVTVNVLPQSSPEQVEDGGDAETDAPGKSMPMSQLGMQK